MNVQSFYLDKELTAFRGKVKAVFAIRMKCNATQLDTTSLEMLEEEG